MQLQINRTVEVLVGGMQCECCEKKVKSIISRLKVMKSLQPTRQNSSYKEPNKHNDGSKQNTSLFLTISAPLILALSFLYSFSLSLSPSLTHPRTRAAGRHFKRKSAPEPPPSLMPHKASMANPPPYHPSALSLYSSLLFLNLSFY